MKKVTLKLKTFNTVNIVKFILKIVTITVFTLVDVLKNKIISTFSHMSSFLT